MEEKLKYWKVGKVTGAQGVRGEIFVLIFSGEAAWLEKLDEALFGGETWSGSAEHKIKVLRKRLHNKQGGTGLILQLEGVSDRDQAEELLKGKFLYIPDDFLQSEPGEQPYLREFLDLKVLTPSGEEVGRIKGFNDNGVQDLLEVHSASGQTYLIPLVWDWIVNRDAEALVMDLPEGLLEVLES